MRHLLILSALCLATFPARAEEVEDGRSLMQRGMELFFDGLQQEVEPTLRELQEMAEELGPAMRSFVQEMGPALEDLMTDVEDWSAYHPPERLENGDIILRRKTPEERGSPPFVEPESQPQIDI